MLWDYFQKFKNWKNYHSVRIGPRFLFFIGKRYVIRGLTPIDCIADNRLLPWCIFSVNKNVTNGAYGQIRKNEERQNKASQEDILNLLEFVLSNGVVSCNGKKFNAHDFLHKKRSKGSVDYKVAMYTAKILEQCIISKSLRYFSGISEIININKDHALFLYTTAKTYKLRPIDVIAPLGGYTEFESWMFDVTITSFGIEKENQEIKKQNDNMARYRKGGR